MRMLLSPLPGRSCLSPKLFNLISPALHKMAGATRNQARNENANASSAADVSGVPEARHVSRPQGHRSGERDSVSRLSADIESTHISNNDSKCKATRITT
jgi:hypothetical protein